MAAKKAGLQQTFKHTQDGLTGKEINEIKCYRVVKTNEPKTICQHRGGKDGFLRFWFLCFFKNQKTSKGRIFCFFMVFLDIVVFLNKLCT